MNGSKLMPDWAMKKITAGAQLESESPEGGEGGDESGDSSAMKLEQTLASMLDLDKMSADSEWNKFLDFVAQQDKADLALVKDFLEDGNWDMDGTYQSPATVLALYAIDRALED